MSKPPDDSPPDEPLAAITRAEVVIEAMITELERRKPGYSRRLLKVLTTPPDDTSVHVLRPMGEPDELVRADAIEWLREASVRARAVAATKRRNRRTRRNAR